MTYFSWLHLTDFHQGMTEQDRLWPQVKDRFFEDLEYLDGKCGIPWDLVLFTGDLTYKGDASEFDQIDDLLSEMWEFFKNKLHFKVLPKLLVVPGNHDLVRPEYNEKYKSDPNYKNAVERLADNFDKISNFWTESNLVERDIVKDSFSNYQDWWTNQKYRPKNLQIGILPGDFSYTFQKDDASLGILGLNTSFLQLTGGNYQGRLALNPLQFNNACLNNDGPRWIRQHNACLLMTHHPPNWLCNGSLEQLQQNIIADHFAVHLCGHMHESAYQVESTLRQRTLQGRSLFGLDYYGEKDRIDNDKKPIRSHGYSVGIMKLNGNSGRLFFYPRTIQLQENRFNNIVPDYYFLLNDNHHTDPKAGEFTLKQPYSDIPWESDARDGSRNFNLEEYQNIVRRILIQQKQINGYKLLHEALQYSSCELSEIQNHVANRILTGTCWRLFRSMPNSWRNYTEGLEDSIKLDYLNADFRELIEDKYSEKLVKISNAVSIAAKIMTKWNRPEDVEQSINNLIQQLCELQTIISVLLTIVDNDLKDKIQEFNSSIVQLKASINL